MGSPDMPAFQQRDLTPAETLPRPFPYRQDREAFLPMLGEPASRTGSVWFPRYEPQPVSVARAAPTTVRPGRYPVYVVSKGRADTRLTGRALEQLGLPYWMVVEPVDHDAYAAVMDPTRILVLPFSDLGQGSIPARNWIWDHAVQGGARRHWILDDNLDGFYRLQENTKTRVVDANPFTPVEQWVDRFQNVRVAGLQYESFCPRRKVWPPYVLNTRVYSCLLLDHQCRHRWRGRYNEDTDLSLRVLKDGDCTVLFNAVLCKKLPTMQLAGGNTDLYQGDGRRQMAESLRAQHPDVVRVTRKWGRWQHQVDYRSFRRNRLIPRGEVDGS